MALRRFPVYLVIDTSGSMTGDPIEAVRRGVKLLISELMGDPMALELVFLSVITFDSTAQQVVPLTELASFQEPRLDAGGSTSLGAALNLLLDTADRELVKSTEHTKGDYKPLVFLMTNGMPTDSWEKAADKVIEKGWYVVACAAGTGADEMVLKRITETVVRLNVLPPGLIGRFVTSDPSLPVEEETEDSPVILPPPPPGVRIVP